MILVGGETLIDFILTRSSGAPDYLARPGEQPYNVAIGLGRLATLTAFIGSISNDFFGDQLVEPNDAGSIAHSRLSGNPSRFGGRQVL